MTHRLTLDYTLAEGWLAPWLEGLRRGAAVASTCPSCGDAQFPPLRACPACRSRSDGWRVLSGAATILYRTTGLDGDFALLRFDGAAGATVARSGTLPADARRVRLAPCPEDPPTLVLKPEPSP